MSEIFTGWFKSPIGLIKIEASDIGITRVDFLDEEVELEINLNKHIKESIIQLRDYFESNRKNFDLELDLQGTDFQKKVWDYLLGIPFGETDSYGTVASALGDRKLVRAVGSANGQNPVALIVPCHRVIGSDGSLTGYAGGVNRKEWLLDHEGARFRKEDQIELF